MHAEVSHSVPSVHFLSCCRCVDEALGPNMHSVTGSNFKIDTEGSTSQSHW